MRASHWVWVPLLAWVACSDRELPEVDVPADWQHVETRCQFAFDAPPELTQLPAQGTDSCVVAYELEGCTLEGGSGGFADPLTSYGDQLEHSLSMVRVDGEDATLVRYHARESGTDRPYFTGVYIPKGGRDFGLSVDLHAWCTSAAAQARATRVLYTITSTL
jgi:hypothetical protein